MKRIHAIIITLALALLLTACGDKSTTPAGNNNSATKAPNSPTSSANNDSTTPTNKPTDPVANTPTPEPENSPTPAVLASGLYNDQNELKKSWEELITSEKIKVEDGMLTYVNENLIGMLVIDESVIGIKTHEKNAWNKLVGPFDGTAITKVVLPVSFTEIPDGTFKFSSITAVEIPNTVTRIGDFAFSDCYKLETITLPSSLVEIGEFAFGGCLMLKELELPDGLKVIKDRALDNCRNLKKLIIPKSVEVCPNGYNLFNERYGHTITIVIYSNENRHGLPLNDYVESPGYDPNAFVCPIPTSGSDWRVTAVVEDDSPELAYCIKFNIKYEIMDSSSKEN
ncbi:MAG: leucine-rich repeat protein [Lachnospiraceae bacterium]|nr:leucine-rich repeat protein [Lachnospiraceae bacterium]